MDKLILKEREIKENIIQTINLSELPAMIIKYILEDILKQIELAEQSEYLIAYQNSQKVEK